MRIGGARCAPPPSQTGRADFPHPAFQSADFDGLPPLDRPLPSSWRRPSGSSPRRRAQPHGTTSTLARWPSLALWHCLPASLRSTVVTRFFATTNALTPAEPFVTPCRGSLIHVTRTSHHSVSYHLRSSTRRVPLPQRWPHYFVRASPVPGRLARTADRIEFTLLTRSDEPCYGLVVHFQLLSTRGYRPGAVTFSYWPYSVGQVRDFHPAVPVRSQAHQVIPTGFRPPGYDCCHVALPGRGVPPGSAGIQRRCEGTGRPLPYLLPYFFGATSMVSSRLWGASSACSTAWSFTGVSMEVAVCPVGASSALWKRTLTMRLTPCSCIVTP